MEFENLNFEKLKNLIKDIPLFQITLREDKIQGIKRLQSYNQKWEEKAKQFCEENEGRIEFRENNFGSNGMEYGETNFCFFDEKNIFYEWDFYAEYNTEKIKNPSQKEIGYIKKIYEEEGKKYLDIDYIQYFTGEKAVQAAEEDELLNCCPNGYYIRNESHKIRTFEIDDEAIFLKFIMQHSEVMGNSPMGYEEFRIYSNRYFLVMIYISDEVVIKTEEIFTP